MRQMYVNDSVAIPFGTWLGEPQLPVDCGDSLLSQERLVCCWPAVYKHMNMKHEKIIMADDG